MYRLFTAAAALLLSASFNLASANPLQPAVIDFTGSLDVMRASLGPHCSRMEERLIEPAQLPGTRDSHVQIDCHGFEYGGKARLAEFVFRDGAFVLVWVLTEAAEAPGLEAALQAMLGAPSHQSPTFTAFTGHRTALRKDKPELLFYAPDMAGMFSAWFDQSVKAAAQKDKQPQG